MENITEIRWNALCDSIMDKKCILFLGPGITVNYRENNNLENTYEKISKDTGQVIYHRADNLLVFKDNDYIADYRTEIKEFYSQDFSNLLLEKIAEIPFHLVISVTPDSTMKNIFKRKNFLFQDNYFSKTNKRKIEFDTKEIPLLYNLFGDVADAGSIIFSHFNLFEYLEWGWVNNSLPETIKTVFNKEQTTNIIFLGFEFDKWYYQLILYLFKLNFEGCRRYAMFQERCEGEMQTLCEANYRINFLNRNTAEFVDKLYENFPADKRRKAATEAEKPKKWLKQNFVKFLNAAFQATELETFCMCYFDEVYNQFGAGQNKLSQINLLLDYVTRNEQFAELMDYCKEHNTPQFDKFAPYYE